MTPASLTRIEIGKLIDELKFACRQPLFHHIRDFEETRCHRFRRRRDFRRRQHYCDHRDQHLTNNASRRRSSDIARRHPHPHSDRPKISRSASNASGGSGGGVIENDQPDAKSQTMSTTRSSGRQQQTNANTNMNNNDNNNNNNNTRNNKRQRSDEGSRQEVQDQDYCDDYDQDYVPRTWDMIVADISTLLPCMTEKEHGQVSKLVAVLFLGFLLPQSTGNDFFLLQNLSSAKSQQELQQRRRTTGTQNIELKEDIGDYIFSMSLEERLECSQSRYDAGGFGEVEETIIFEPVEHAFQAFIQDGLRPFLRSRPVHKSQVDLLHIIAMAIHPEPSEQAIRETAAKLEREESDSWERTKRLMHSLVPHSFQIHYRHRIQLVEMVSNDMILPKKHQDDGLLASRLYEGAMPHLRVSLTAFGMAAMTSANEHAAQCSLVSLAIQSRVENVVREEWGRLLHRLVDDQTKYTIDSSSYVPGESGNTVVDSSKLPKSPPTEGTVNLHHARGKLLNDFLMRICESRNCASNDFLQYALTSLADAIEMQVDRWTVGQPDSEPQAHGISNNDANMNDPTKYHKTTLHPPDVLVALLAAAKTLFCFLLPIKDTNEDEEDNDEESESEEGHRRDMLISCGIQLIHHWDHKIVKEACAMLIFVFSYTEELWDDYVGAVFASVSLAIQSSLKRSRGMDAIEALIATLSQRSAVFAEGVLQLLLKDEEANAVPALRLVAAIAISCPSAALSKRDTLVRILRTCSDIEGKKQLLAALLACRKAVFLDGGEGSSELADIIQTSSLRQLDYYHLARHALQVGHPTIAKILFRKLMDSADSQSSYVWFVGLEYIAAGDELLASDATLGLVGAAALMKNAKRSFQSVSSLSRQPYSAAFQTYWLDLRVSHLDLLRVLRQLTQEMRLTGVGPKKNTRPHVHLSNAIKLWVTLSQKYRSFRKRYGLFICQQSRSALKTLQGHCLFLAMVTKTMFFDSLPNSTTEQLSTKDDTIIVGDHSQPLTLFAHHVKKVVLEKIDSSVGGNIRAAALLRILDGTVKVPFPVPRALTVAKVIPNAYFDAYWDPSEHKDLDYNSSIQDVVDFPTGSVLKFQVSGFLPSELISAATLPFNVILLWVNVTPVGGTASDKGINAVVAQPPASTTISPNGRFFTSIESDILMKEGPKKVSFTLGCRDIHGGVWELPTKSEFHLLINVVNHS